MKEYTLYIAPDTVAQTLRSVFTYPMGLSLLGFSVGTHLPPLKVMGSIIIVCCECSSWPWPWQDPFPTSNKPKPAGVFGQFTR